MRSSVKGVLVVLVLMVLVGYLDRQDQIAEEEYLRNQSHEVQRDAEARREYADCVRRKVCKPL